MLFKNSNPTTMVKLFALIIIALSFTACEKEDPIPTITQLKVCNSAPSGSVLCSSNQSTFEMTSPTFYASAVFSNITKDTPVSFKLYGKNVAGEWMEVFSQEFRPSEAGTFDDEDIFDLSTNFTKGATQLWPAAQYKIEARIEAAEGALSTVNFSVQ